MKYLLIGGHNDGKRIELDEPLPKICLPVYPKRSTGIDEPFEDCKTEIYEAIPFEANGGRLWIYVLDGMTAHQALQALIERYPEQPAAAKLIGADMGTGKDFTATAEIQLCECGKPCYVPPSGILSKYCFDCAPF